MLEEKEELLEQWFFERYANGLDLDLEVYFCIDQLRSTLFLTFCILMCFFVSSTPHQKNHKIKFKLPYMYKSAP